MSDGGTAVSRATGVVPTLTACLGTTVAMIIATMAAKAQDISCAGLDFD